MLGRRPVFIVGYMSAGKSTVGRYLAEALGFDFIDTDFFLEARFRRRVSDMFLSVGEAVFRNRERVVLEELSGMERTVIATGGGLPCYGKNMDLMLLCGETVYLEVRDEVLAARLEFCKRTRPTVREKHGEELRSHVAEAMAFRRPYYSRANYIVDANNLNGKEDERLLADRIASLLKRGI